MDLFINAVVLLSTASTWTSVLHLLVILIICSGCSRRTVKFSGLSSSRRAATTAARCRGERPHQPRASPPCRRRSTTVGPPALSSTVRPPPAPDRRRRRRRRLIRRPETTAVRTTAVSLIHPTTRRSQVLLYAAPSVAMVNA